MLGPSITALVDLGSAYDPAGKHTQPPNGGRSSSELALPGNKAFKSGRELQICNAFLLGL